MDWRGVFRVEPFCREPDETSSDPKARWCRYLLDEEGMLCGRGPWSCGEAEKLYVCRVCGKAFLEGTMYLRWLLKKHAESHLKEGC